ncbi:MAG: acyl carrier protein [Granulosicoccus sp.]
MNYTEDTIHEQLKQIVGKLFEVDAADVVAEARLYEDLDIDSIDAVNMIIELRRITGQQIPAERFREARTVADVVRTTVDVLNADIA